VSYYLGVFGLVSLVSYFVGGAAGLVLCILGFLSALAAFVLGVWGLAWANRSQPAQGTTASIVGMVLGSLVIVGQIVALVLLLSSAR
jgi:hypothetical protein